MCGHSAMGTEPESLPGPVWTPTHCMLIWGVRTFTGVKGGRGVLTKNEHVQWVPIGENRGPSFPTAPAALLFPSKPFPWGICTCCSLCLPCSPPDVFMTPPSPLSTYMLFSSEAFPDSLFKMTTSQPDTLLVPLPPFTGGIYPLSDYNFKIGILLFIPSPP